MNKKNTLLLLCILIQSGLLFAQQKANVIVPFGAKVESILINHYTGSVIVKDRDALQSYNPETNTIEWKINDKEISNGNALNNAQAVIDNVESGDFLKLLEAKKDEINFIDNSPFISLAIDNKDVIINSADGKVVYNSGEFGYRVLQSEFMPAENALLLMVINNKTYSCVYYDLEKGTQKWITELASVDSFLKSLKSLLSFKSENLSEDKVLTTDSDLYVSINGSLYKMNKADGKIAWQTDFKMSNFFLSESQKNLVMIRTTGNILSSKIALNLLDVKTGDKLWKDDITTKYITYIEDAGDKILIAHANGFNFYSYADGKKVWKKDAKGNKIKKVISVGNDYLYVADKEMNLIGKDGISKWKKFIEICDNEEDEIYNLGKVDNNRVFYLTDSYGNMVDYTTGKKVWKKDINFDKNRPVLYKYDEGQKVYLVYNDKKLYKFDPNSVDEKKNEPFAKLKDVKSDHTMADIELFDWGVSLIGQSDAIGVGFDGEVKYHNTYKEPGGNKRGWLKGGRALYSFATTGQASFATDSGKGGFGMSFSGAEDENGRPDFSNTDPLFTARMESRFNALKHNSEYAFLINKAESGGAELVKVRKSDGKEVDRISVESEKPIYEIDHVTNNVYYIYDNEMRVYSQK
ncbi:PQQ-binding-like beta-propeller repeat protein [Dysgonomonas sp. ZJ709]|uniref:outer membrane protein assembly factor BamB family protein n=1 Tax=Dysgonomonas sp. ZJ709 TaxID=2709797 RepID=UPI0013EC327D|nr:PQQ-binding-like beta-propeller repeat protein [Dysgonomonas sp. ZJ709]